MKLIVKRGSLKIPGQSAYVRKGDAVPEGALTAADVHALLAAGVLSEEVPLGPSTTQTLPPTRGKWQHDPAALAGKGAEQLRAMVLDEDPTLDVTDLSEASMVQLLTSDYEPVFNMPKVLSSDRHRPSEQALNKARRGAARP